MAQKCDSKKLQESPTPDARTIAIQPYDATILPDIEKALIMANIGITPMNDGQLIRLPIPELTEERRKDMVKDLKGKAEQHKVKSEIFAEKATISLKKLLKTMNSLRIIRKVLLQTFKNSLIKASIN